MNIDNVLGQLHVMRQRQNPDFIFVARPTTKPELRDGRLAKVSIVVQRGALLMTSTAADLSDGEIVHYLLEAERKFIARSSRGPQHMTTDHNVWHHERVGSSLNWKADILLTPMSDADQGPDNYGTQSQRPVSASVYYGEREYHAPSQRPIRGEVSRCDAHVHAGVSVSVGDEPTVIGDPSAVFAKPEPEQADQVFDTVVADHMDPVVDEVQRMSNGLRHVTHGVTLLPRTTSPMLDKPSLSIIIHDGTDLVTTAKLLISEEQRYYAELRAKIDPDTVIEHSPITWLRSRTKKQAYATWLGFMPADVSAEPAIDTQVQKQERAVNLGASGDMSVLDKVPATNMRLAQLMFKLARADTHLATVETKARAQEQDWADTHPGVARSVIRWYATPENTVVLWRASFYYDVDTDVANRAVHVNRAFEQQMAAEGYSGVDDMEAGTESKLVLNVAWLGAELPVEHVAQRLMAEVVTELLAARAVAHADFRWVLQDDGAWAAEVFYIKAQP